MTELIFGNRVVETCFASGTGPFSLQNRLETYYSRFSEKFQIGSAVTYCALYNDLKEIGYGILTSENQLTRLKVYDSSTPNGFVNSATPGNPSFVDFPDGSQITIFNDIPAQLLILIGTNGELVNPGPIRDALFVADTAAMKALVDIQDKNKIFVVSNGLFVYDEEDAADPDNVDTFRLDGTTTGLFKRDRMDIQGDFKGSMTVDAKTGDGGEVNIFTDGKAGNPFKKFRIWGDRANKALRVSSTANQPSNAEKNFLSIFSLGTMGDAVQVHEPIILPSRSDATGIVTRTLTWLSSVSRLVLMMAGGGHREIPLTKGYVSITRRDIYTLKQEDPLALSMADGDVACTLGSNTVSGNSTDTNAGNVEPIYWYWSSASSATADDVTYVRPSVGPAASGAGRWVRLVSDVTANGTFTSGVATPSVKNGTWFLTAGTTPITNLLNGYEGQYVTIQRGSADIIIVHDPTKIDIGASIELTTTMPRITLRNVGGVWRIVSSAAGFIQGGTSPVARSTLSKAREVVTPEDFGALGDGTTNDYTAMVNAAAYAALTGRELWLCGKYYLGANDFTLPAQCIMSGSLRYMGYPDTNARHDYRSLKSQLIFASTYGLKTPNPSCNVSGVCIRMAAVGLGARQDANYAADCAAILALYAGTAITNTADNNKFSDLLILGFGIAVDGTAGHRANYQRIGYDCNSGILQEAVYDVSRARDCHGWCYLTVGLDPSDASSVWMIRPGVGFRWKGITDGCTADHCFAYGYTQGFVFDGSTDVTATACWSDRPPGSPDNNSIGFHNLNGARNTTLMACKTSSQGRGFIQNSDGVMTLNNPSSWVISDTHILHLEGVLQVINPNIDNLGFGGTAKGVSIGSSIDAYVQIGGVFKDISCFTIDPVAAPKTQIVGSPIYLGTCTDQAVNTQKSLTILPDGSSEGGQLTLLPGTGYSHAFAIDVFNNNGRLFFNSAIDHVVEVANFGSGGVSLTVDTEYRVNNTRVLSARSAAVGAVNVTYTTGGAPSLNGNVTFANSAAPQPGELLDYIAELDNKVNLIRQYLGATSGHGLLGD